MHDNVPCPECGADLEINVAPPDRSVGIYESIEEVLGECEHATKFYEEVPEEREREMQEWRMEFESKLLEAFNENMAARYEASEEKKGDRD